MRTEAKKTFASGFFVTEQEIRRIVDTLTTQFEKVPCSCVPSTAVEIRFRNGTISESSTLDQVFQLENAGSGTIERLRFRLASSDSEPAYAVELTLAFASYDDRESPIKYLVKGEDRDWVFVTSSLLDERLARIKRIVVPDLLGSRRLFPSVSMLIILAGMMIPMFTRLDTSRRRQSAFLDSLDHAWRTGALHDPVQAMILGSRARLDADDLPARTILLYPIGILGGVMALLYLVGKARPPFVFYWGEAAGAYDRRIKLSYFFGVVLVLGLLLSIIGSFLANRIHL